MIDRRSVWVAPTEMASSLTAQLRVDPPLLHDAGTDYWGLAWPALAWLERALTAITA